MQAVTQTETRAPIEPGSVATEPAAVPSGKRVRPAFKWASISLLVVLALGVLSISKLTHDRHAAEPATLAETPAPDSSLVRIADYQTQNLRIEPVGARSFSVEKVTTGKIGFNEEVMTPVFSPYAGRVLRLIAKPGDSVTQGSPLFEIETPELVQAEQDLIGASIGVSRARTVLDLATRAEDRQHLLYVNKAGALKDWEQAEADQKNAERDLHSAENALMASRARLRVFGKTGEETEKIEADRQIDRVARVASPLGGTIVARKVGPGQYVKPDSPDPLFTIADLSTVWLLADVYESDVPLIKTGQQVEVRVAAYPNESFKARIAYIGVSVDPATHRVAVRSVVENRAHKLKPEMFASFRLMTGSETQSLAVPVSAIVREGGKTSVWVRLDAGEFSRREVTTGLEQGNYVQVLSGLRDGDRVVSEGSIFISNLASS